MSQCFCNEDAIVLVLSHCLLFPHPMAVFMTHSPKGPPSPDSASSPTFLAFSSTLLVRGVEAKTWVGDRVGNTEETLSAQPKFRDEASSNEEDDALRHHDLIVILHLAQSSLDLN